MKGIRAFFNFVSFLTPRTVYHYDLRVTNEELKVKVLREVSGDIFDYTTFETWQMFVIGNDGTKIPMFIVTQRGVVLDGNHPTLFCDYGGFNTNLIPNFNVSCLVFA
jgi:prolyl oligopeptidase